MSPALIGARALLVQAHDRLVARMHAQRDALQVEQDLDDVLLHALDARVLVQDAVDLGLDDRAAGHRRQQDAPQRVAQRVAEAPLEGLDDDARVLLGDLLDLDQTRLEKFGDGCGHERLTSIASPILAYLE